MDKLRKCRKKPIWSKNYCQNWLKRSDQQYRKKQLWREVIIMSLFWYAYNLAYVSICILLGLRTKILDCTVKKKSLRYSVFKIAMVFQEPFNSSSSVILNTFSLRESDCFIRATQEYETLHFSCLKKGNALPFIS